MAISVSVRIEDADSMIKDYEFVDVPRVGDHVGLVGRNHHYEVVKSSVSHTAVHGGASGGSTMRVEITVRRRQGD